MLDNIQTDYYQRREIANSTLSLINEETGGSPKLFKMYLDGNIQKTTPSLSLENGLFLHLFVENPELFVVSEVNKPNENLQKIADQYLLLKDTYLELSQDELLLKSARLAGYYKNYKDETLLATLKKSELVPYIEELEKNSGKYILTAEQKITIQNCIDSLKSHEACNKYLFEEWENCDIFHEKEIYFTHLEVDCKSRLDRLIVNHNTKHLILVDLKTTSKKAQFFPKESWEFWRYARQFAFYKLALSYEYPGYSFECYIPVVDTQFFTRRCFKVSDSQIDIGEIEYTRLLNLVKWHIHNNEWNYTKEEYENNYILNL